MNSKPNWRDSDQYVNYLRGFKSFYQNQPIFQISLQLILSIFAVAFFGFLAIRPTLATISTLVKKIEDQKIVDTKLDKKIVQLRQAQEDLRLYGAEIETLTNKAVPYDPEIDRLSQLIEAVAVESGVVITSLEYQASPLVGGRLSILDDAKATPPKGDLFVTFGFAVGGDLNSINRFLAEVENIERVMMITKVGIIKPENNFQDSFQLIANGRITTNYLPQQE